MHAEIYTTNKYGQFVKRRVFPGEPLSRVVNITADKTYEHTGFMGFGVAITGSSCYNLSLMKPTERHELLTHLYGADGLNFGIGRLSIGTSDYSAEVYSYDDVKDDVALEYFSIERDKEYIIPIVKEILQIKPDLALFASPWSPPGWMKAGGNLGGGFMRDKYLDCYADYFVKYLKAYEAEGIPIYAVTPQNEPLSHHSGHMPGCLWHPETEAKFIQILRGKLDENRMGTKIWCYDHNFFGADRVEWMLKEYPDVAQSCGGMAFHYYDSNIEETWHLQEEFPDIPMHFTEGGPRLYDNYDCDWCKWTIMMSKALNHRFASFTGWNLMLDETGGPNVGPFFCGGLVTRNYVDGTLSYSGQYKAFRHFSFVTPESRCYPLRFVGAGANMFAYPKGDFLMEGTLVENPKGQTVLVLANRADQKVQLQYFKAGRHWYIEMLPDTVATVVIQE